MESDKDIINYNQFYVKPHNKISRDVTDSDINRVIEDGQIMLKLCHTPVGRKSGGYAVAHCQINDIDPLRFFMLRTGMMIINPIITRHTKTTISSMEGCLTFPEKEDIEVQRYNKIDVEYSVIINGKISERIKESYNGIMSKIYQHEIDHFEGKYIYGH